MQARQRDRAGGPFPFQRSPRTQGIQKHVALHKISSLQSEFKELEAELVKKYGDNVTINLETGEIKENVEDK